MSEFCIAYAAKYNVRPDSRDFPGLAYAAKMAYKTRLRGGSNWNYPQHSPAGGAAPPALTEEQMAYMKNIPFPQTEPGWDKMEWEHEFRLEEKRCRYYDCELPNVGVALKKCPCHAEGVVYCSTECQKLDWSLMHHSRCAAVVKK